MVLQRPENRCYPWPGNVRELEQVIRRIILHGSCRLHVQAKRSDDTNHPLFEQQPTVAELTSRYCGFLYNKYGNYQEIARITGLDRRTVKKYVERG